MSNRLFRYWGRRAEYFVGVIVAISVMYFILLRFIMAGGDDFGSFLQSISFYVLCMSAVFLSIMPITIYEYDLPLTISLGERRKGAFWGIHVMNVIYIIEMTIILGVAYEIAFRLTGHRMFSGFHYPLLGFILLAAMGEITMVICLKFGKKGGCLFLLSVVAVFVVGGILSFVFGNENGIRFDFHRNLVQMLPFLTASVLLYLGLSPLLGRALERYEVGR